MAKTNNKRNAVLSPRQKLLNSKVEFLPLPDQYSTTLREMGFSSVREAFRAALAGRLATRKKGGKKFEDLVLEAGCSLLGHPRLSRDKIRTFRPQSDRQTIGEALLDFVGQPFKLSPNFLRHSIREMLLPSTMHDAILCLHIESLDELTATPVKNFIQASDINSVHIGSFLTHIFDYIFIVNEQKQKPSSIELDIPAPPPSTTTSAKTERLLAPWFSEDTIAAGNELLAAKSLKNTIIFRNGAAGLFLDADKEFKQTIILFEDAPAIPQGFKISHTICGHCPEYRAKHELCPHAAALTISLSTKDARGKLPARPLPLFFRESPWYLAGQIIFDLYGPGSLNFITADREDDKWRLTITHEAGHNWVSWLLDEQQMRETIAVYGALISVNGELKIDADEATATKEAFSLLTALARTPTEIELNDLEKRTIGQERDESIWMWLGGRLCMSVPAGQLQIRRQDQEELFSLAAAQANKEGDTFRLTLPRAKTPDLLDGLALLGQDDNILPPAQAYSQATFAEGDNLVIYPHLRLADNRTLRRTDLEQNRFGRYYHLPDEGFLPVREQRPEHTFSESTNQPLTIKANDIPAFVENNQTPIHAPENDIPESLTTFEIKDAPDNLELDSFSFDDDWCYLSGHYGVGNRNISLTELLAARRKNLNFLPSQGNWLKLTDSSLDWLHNLGEDRIWSDSDQNTKGIRLSKQEMLMLSALIPDLTVKGEEKDRNHLRELLDTDSWLDCRDLDCIPTHLRDYQRNGIAWLYHLYRNGLAGILADDMGLGKTHQALGLLTAINAMHPGPHRYLIVCPATVVPHWADKIEQFFPDFSYYIYHGTRRNLKAATENQLFITTYGIVRRDAEELAKLDFDVIFFDEVQQVKNKKTGVYTAARRLNGKIVVGLTGTPLENSVYDLKAIFDICLPGFLGKDKTFRTRYADPIGELGDKKKKDTLARLINPFLLRRTREQVLTELPEVIEDIRTCKLSEDQIRLYREVIANQGRPLLDQVDASSTGKKLPYMKLLAVINYLKQICNHPCLMHNTKDSELFASGKWDLFVELLHECLDSGMKIVVFSHYTRMLDIIENYLAKNDISYCGLRGEMPLKKRHDMIKKFNTDKSCRVFSASLLAGGVGVDLTAAQAVIHYDRWWNAAREDQATARVHRMGQKHVVQVFKLVTIGTLEEKIDKMIEKKRNLASHLVREDDSDIVKRLNREELLELLAPTGV